MNKSGYTLIEMMVVIALMAIVMVTTTQILTVIVRSNSKTRAILEVKQSGDNALLTIKQQLRNATTIDLSSCSGLGTGTNVSFTNNNGEDATITCSEAGIVMVIGSGVGERTENLITSELSVTGSADCFTCYMGSGSPEIVTVAFGLQKAGGTQIEGFDLNFSANLSLRTYE